MKNQNTTQKQDNNLMLVLMSGSSTTNNLKKARHIIDGNCKSCIVCLSQTHHAIMDNLRELKMNEQNFLFIDAVSEFSGSTEQNKNCIFIHGLDDIRIISSTIARAAQEHQFEKIIFDDLSALLSHQETDTILKFTNDLLRDEEQNQVTKVFMLSKHNSLYSLENTKLIKDLYLFADKLIDLDQER